MSWRELKPTDKQLDVLEDHGIFYSYEREEYASTHNRGTCSDIIENLIEKTDEESLE